MNTSAKGYHTLDYPKPTTRKLLSIVGLGFVGHALFTGAYFLGYEIVNLFCLLTVGIMALVWPSHLFSPLTVIYGYYTVWYLIPLQFAEKYEVIQYANSDVVLATWMLFTTLWVSVLSIVLYDRYVVHKSAFVHIIVQTPARNVLAQAKIYMWSCFGVCLFAIAGLIQNSGGIQPWIDAPGKTFLTREGGGVYSILLIFGSMLFALTAGYLAKEAKNILYYIFALVFLVFFSPFLGGKMQNFLSLFFLAAPTIYTSRAKGAILWWISILFIFTFLLGIYFRNLSWITWDQLLRYSLNYFNTFELLVISVQDFSPSWLSTVFLPFNKLLTPFGTKENIFYDMSAWLTSIYFPESWAIRATEQWPIETDFYLSFHYVFGLPLLAIYILILQYTFFTALHKRTLGWVFVSTHMSFNLMSHFRGGLILWNDLYTIPFYLVAILLLRRQVLDQRITGAKRTLNRSSSFTERTTFEPRFNIR